MAAKNNRDDAIEIFADELNIPWGAAEKVLKKAMSGAAQKIGAPVAAFWAALDVMERDAMDKFLAELLPLVKILAKEQAEKF